LIKTAVLVLEDGTAFYGRSIGIAGISTGEVVFNTSMTGYQEILTDPSYCKQIITFTYPHIGNVGTNKNDEESQRVYASGIVVRDLSPISSSYKNEMDLSKYLEAKNIVGISCIDTRKLTLLIRRNGTQNCCIMHLRFGGYKLAYRYAKNSLKLENVNLVEIVTTKHKYFFKKKKIVKYKKKQIYSVQKKRFFVVVYDFGVKSSILENLDKKNCIVLVVPADTSFESIVSLNPDGIFLSNGPGDPRPCLFAIKTIKEFLKINIPIFGICLGHQLLALASGGKIFKMRYGHHGGNHPVKDLSNNSVLITSQNHNFSLDPTYLSKNMKISHVSLFDNTVQGFFRTDKKAFGFQGHPESGPGPNDSKYLFDVFINLMNK